MRAALILGIALSAGCAGSPRPSDLHAVRSWAIQLQGIERSSRLARLESSSYDLLVIDRVHTVRGLEQYDTASLVRRLRATRLCLAYFNVGQAENYRTHWQRAWREPNGDGPGSPDFLLAVDPDGWAGDFPVAFWDARWRTILMDQIDDVVARGFDGVYCDWVLGYEEPAVAAAAARANVDPARAMAELLRDLRKRARRSNPRFRLVMQNGGALFRRVPALAGWVDGYAQEPLSFRGKAGVPWEDADGADVAIPAKGDWSTAAMLDDLRFIRAKGVATFTIDYCIDPANARLARERARSVGAVPFVSRAILDRLP